MRLGRPMKYRHILEALDPSKLYSPALVAHLSLQRGLHGKNLDEVALALVFRRIRIAMARFGTNHKFPKEGDGQVKLKGQAFTPAWFGWRWQQAAGIPTNSNNHEFSQHKCG